MMRGVAGGGGGGGGINHFRTVLAICLIVAAVVVWLTSIHLVIDADRCNCNFIAPPGMTKRQDDPFELARTQSFGYFYDVPEGHWRRLRDIFLEHENHKYPDKPLTYHPEATADEARPEIYKNRVSKWKGWSSYPAWYQNNYEPNFAGCQFEKRVGEPMNGDGPKWVCDPHRIKILAQKRKAKDPGHPDCVIYSVGSNGDFTFELGMQKEVGEGTCEYHIFDPGNFEHRKPSKLKRAYYHQWGLEEQKESQSCLGFDLKKRSGGQSREKYCGLQDTVKLLGHENLDAAIDIFKIDCEGCEWTTYHDWLSDSVPLLQQLLVEVHKAPKDKALDFFNSLERAGYLRYHKEPNIQWGPGCLEYAFVRVDKSFVEGKMEMLAR